MFSAKRITLIGAATLGALSWNPLVLAADDAASVLPAPAPALMPAVASDPPRKAFGSKPLAAGALAAKRGGDGVFNENQLKGVVADNRASNLTTGMNLISEGAFSGASGLSTVIQNSGNNVLIQNSTIVNVQVK